MTDYISREAALDRIRDYIEEYGEPEENGLHNLKWCAMMKAEMVLTEIPAADVREVDKLTKAGKRLLKYCPEIINEVAEQLDYRLDSFVLNGGGAEMKGEAE